MYSSNCLSITLWRLLTHNTGAYSLIVLNLFIFQLRALPSRESLLLDNRSTVHVCACLQKNYYTGRFIYNSHKSLNAMSNFSIKNRHGIELLPLPAVWIQSNRLYFHWNHTLFTISNWSHVQKNLKRNRRKNSITKWNQMFYLIFHWINIEDQRNVSIIFL